uniref:Uncharacterized protein n=1 Tax=viral metagenome TaxID=1070528 RepID=A0A6H2A345_9ZZZZ
MATTKKLKILSLDELPYGHPVFVECPLPDGGGSFWLGRIGSVTAKEINLFEASWVAQAGERWKFQLGEYDDDCQIHPLVPTAVKRLPRWGALVDDWPHPLPAEPVGAAK